MDNKGKWATLSIADGMIFEGVVVNEAAWGLYFNVGGQEDRLWLVPWSQVVRIVYKAGL